MEVEVLTACDLDERNPICLSRSRAISGESTGARSSQLSSTTEVSVSLRMTPATQRSALADVSMSSMRLSSYRPTARRFCIRQCFAAFAARRVSVLADCLAGNSSERLLPSHGLTCPELPVGEPSEVAGPYATSPVCDRQLRNLHGHGSSTAETVFRSAGRWRTAEAGYGSAACAASVGVPVISRCARLNVRY